MNYAEQKIIKEYFTVFLEADENKHCISECKTHDTNNDTNLHHILLLNKASRVSYGIRRCTDWKNH